MAVHAFTVGSHSATGYVNDVPYTYHFARELTPAWLDFVATLSGFEAPAPTGRFAWCELGCGQGLTAAILAATHPNGEFHAIDAYEPHVERARQLSASAGVTNLTLHATDFDAATDLDLPCFDYIVAHGVYTWIDSQGRADMRRFIDRWLKPGGLVLVSYNAMPGWASDAPFQYLLREVAEHRGGNSVEQFVDGMKVIEALAAAGAPSLLASVMVSGVLEQLRKELPDSYFSHEFLPTAWQPLYVTQVRGDMAGIGLTPIGSATIRENFDTFVLTPAARDALAAIADADLRELARDYFLNQRFRRDVFAREPRRIGEADRAWRLSAYVFDLQRPADQVEAAMGTDAITPSVDNDAARAIVAALRTGPKRLTDIGSEHSFGGDLLATALALCAANEIRPVNATWADVETLNKALAGHIGAANPVRFVALPCGTAVAVAPALVRESPDGEVVPPERLRWLEFVGRYEGSAFSG